jgi:phage shock protein E
MKPNEENPVNERPAKYVVVKDLERLMKEDSAVMLIDARTAEEFDEGHIPGAINVPITGLREFARNLQDASDGPVVTMCGSTGRGEKAAEILESHALEYVLVLDGGLKAWKDAGLPVA